jgi:YD repeat-containing protein
LIRRLVLLALAGVLTATASFAEQHRNQLKGFTPEGVFQFLGIDNINLFNGNLVLTIPLGQEYPISEGLSYRFQLVCNGNVWESEIAEGVCRSKVGEYDANCTPVSAIPDRRSNAGLGCLVSPGRLFPPHHVTTREETFAWVYESPDAAEHFFYGQGQTYESECDAEGVTEDGTYLRLTRHGPQRWIEFPDGAIHKFEPSGDACADEWRLVEITNRFPANFMRIDYSNPDRWTVTDTHGRTHHVKLETRQIGSSLVPMVASVELEAASTEGAEQSDGRVKYSFGYTPDDSTIVTPYWDSDDDGRYLSNDKVKAPLLTRLTLPDRTAFEIEHEVSGAFNTSGLPNRLRLPTMGCIGWEWGWWSKPTISEEGFSHLQGSHGILRRLISDRSCPTPSDPTQGGLGVWTYAPGLTRETPDSPPCDMGPGFDCESEREMVVRVVDPVGHYTLNYFSVAPHTGDGWFEQEYGAPFTHNNPDPEGRLLTRESYDCPRQNGLCVYDPAGTGTLLRREYVKYESDVGPPIFFWYREPHQRANTRSFSTRTVFADDGGVFIDADQTDYAGFGHYEKSTVSGFRGESDRVTTTDYVPQGGNWLLNLFRSVTVEENGEARVTEHDFDTTTGTLKATRVRKRSGERSADDVLTVLSRNDRGDVIGELTYGGDGANLSADSCCSIPSSAPGYMIRYSHQYGVPSQAEYLDPTSCTTVVSAQCVSALGITDYDIEPKTGLVQASRDPAGVRTTYAYDMLSRLAEIATPTPKGTTTTKYSYLPATASGQARVVETVTGSGGQELIRATFEYDDLGRFVRSSKSLPLGKVAVVDTEYDGLGRKVAVSQPEAATIHPDHPIGRYWTRSSVDAFGRPLWVSAPDGAVTTYAYGGTRAISRTTSVATTLTGSSSATVTETYDARGRLVQVEEASAGTNATTPVGALTTTKYTYDAADRLSRVVMSDGTTSQLRTFDYDGRGFLIAEDHPESEAIQYGEIDGRGHARRRAQGPTILSFVYDAAERLRSVTDGGGRPIKKFDFATANSGADRRNGKLVKAVRHNYLDLTGQIDVTESYEYATANGQLSRRSTLVEKVDGTQRTPLQQFDYRVSEYDDFSLPKRIAMPTCTMHGCAAVGGLTSVEMERSAGFLTSVRDFATLTYHPSGMPEKVRHQTPQGATDTYASRFGLARPSSITFTDCTNTTPYFLPGDVVVKANLTGECGLKISWPAATLCGGASNIRYTVLRNDGRTVASCLTGTTVTDTSVVGPQSLYTYTILAEGPAVTGGAGACQGGRLAEIKSLPAGFNSCGPDTFIEILDNVGPDGVNVPIGAPKTFRARLLSVNGPVQEEELVFNIHGTVRRARTRADGMALVSHVVDDTPGLHENSLVVAYEGPLMPRSSASAHLTLSCEKASYSIQPLSMNLTSGAGSYSVLVNTSTNCEWSPVAGAGAFFGFTPPTLQKGRGVFTVDVPELTNGSSRVGSVLVGGQDVRVEQGSACTYHFEPEIAYVPAQSGGATTSLDITAPAGCEWQVTKDGSASWIEFDGPNSGTGSGTIRLSVQPNSGPLRSGTLTIANGANVVRGYVNQAAPPPVTCPRLLTDLSGGGDIQNGQNITMRFWVEGYPLRYRWWINGQPLADCDFESCAQMTLGPDDPLYPAPGRSATFQVEAFNECGTVSSRAVVWTNTTSNGACAVPVIQDSLLRTNAAPADQNVASPGASTRVSAYGFELSSSGAPLGYQWYRGVSGDRNAPVPDFLGGKTTEIWLNPFATDFFWVEVTNGCGAQQSRTAKISVRSPSKRRTVRSDFNLDDAPDMVWRNRETGRNEVWLMAGTSVRETASLPDNVNSAARIQSIGDLDGDERPDLVWRDVQSGQNEVWVMDGTERRSVEPIEPRPDVRWTIGAMADFDGDEHQDIVWHNDTTGENEIWFQSGAQRTGTWALPKNPEGTWGMHGTADFNGDGKPDLFFHDRATGANSIWIMNDAARVGTLAEGPASGRQLRVTSQSMPAMTNPDWLPAQVVDLNGDSSPDIVWRNGLTGENSVWILSGTSLLETRALPSRPGAEWQIGGGGSSNRGGDGASGVDSRIATAISLTVDPVPVGSPAVVTASLTAASAPIAQRELAFERNGTVVTRLLSGADGTATAVVPLDGMPAGTHANAITVRFGGDATYQPASASATLIVTPPPAKVTWAAPAPIVYGTPLSAAQLNATADVAGTFVYEPPAGTLLDAGQRSLTVTFTPADPGVGATTKSVVLLVQKAPSVISWTRPAPIAYGMPLGVTQLNAASTLPGAFTYDPPAGTMLAVGSNQLLKVTFVPESSNFETSTAVTSIDVNKGTQRIQWTAPTPLTLGEALGDAQLNASVIASGSEPAGTLAYDPPAGTILGEGIHALRVIASETAFYAAASATVDVAVARPVATVAWSTPAPIVYGSPLTSEHLNATSTLPGTFVYSPPAGTILSAGRAVLNVVFTPADSRYLPVSASVTITVNKARPVLTWRQPSAIVYGTSVNAALNAEGSVPGEITYDPQHGTILDAGAGQTLSALLTPLDTVNYEIVVATVQIDVMKAPQNIVWPPPTSIVYGTALSAAQLNARLEVAGPSPGGALSYVPQTGTYLGAGPGQTLTVTAAETNNYLAATAFVSLDVLRAPLTVIVDGKSKLYGAPIPELTGTLSGLVGGDAITATWVTSAKQASPAGSYPITATLADPGSRLLNYDVTITPSSLAVLPAPLTVAANPASKQYSDPVPALTATFAGFVLGETPAVLGGSLSLTTSADARSAPDTYAIAIGGLTSTNYALTYVGGLLTVLPEDARVVITAPLLISSASTGPTTVMLGATIFDISATAEAEGDVWPGDIRTASLAFVDRATYTTLCTAPFALLDASDGRVGMATCTFSRDFGEALPATVTVGARVGGRYVRDSSQDDTVLAVMAPSGDSLTGSGVLDVLTAAGVLAADPGTTASFDTDLRHQNNGEVKGSFRMKFARRQGGVQHTFELVVTSVRSLGTRRTAVGGVATIVGAATLRDVTTPSQPVVIATSAPLVVTATDGGEPSASDRLSVTVYNPAGGIWLATGWNGRQAVEQPLRDGNLTLHYRR